MSAARTAVAERQPAEQTANLPAMTEHRSVLRAMADRYDMEPKAFEATLRATVVPANATREQFAAFLVVANEYKLNPLTKEIYAFPAKGGGIVPIVSIDGWANLMNSHPAFDGMHFTDNLDTGGNVVSITCEMYRKDRTRPISATEYMSECKRTTEPWQKWPRRMLRHKALIQTARYAFGFAGVIDNDEYDRFHGSHARDVTPAPRRQVSVASAFDEFSAPATLPPADSASTTLDHDSETGEVDDFAEDQSQAEQHAAPPAAKPAPKAATPKAEAKPVEKKDAPAAAAKPAAAKPDPITSGPQPAADFDDNPPDDANIDELPEDPQVDQQFSADAGVDEGAADWPEKDVPVDAEQYEQMFVTQCKRATDPAKLQAQFVDDGKLRTKLGMTDVQKAEYVKRVKVRIAELKPGQ